MMTWEGDYACSNAGYESDIEIMEAMLTAMIMSIMEKKTTTSKVKMKQGYE